MPAKKLEKLVDQLFEKINDDLGALLRSLDKAIPLATRTSDLGRRVFGTLEQERALMVKGKEEVGVVEWLGSVGGWKGKQLRRDLKLCRRSAEGVKVSGQAGARRQVAAADCACSDPPADAVDRAGEYADRVQAVPVQRRPVQGKSRVAIPPARAGRACSGKAGGGLTPLCSMFRRRRA